MGSATSLVTVSVGPPAANGTTNVIVPVGFHAVNDGEGDGATLCGATLCGAALAGADADGLAPVVVHALTTATTATLMSHRGMSRRPVCRCAMGV
jgi:hypothetical protein